MCFILPSRRSGSPGIAHRICRGSLDTSTTDVKALRAAAGLASQDTRVTQKEDEMGTTLRWTSADLEVLHNDCKRYEIIDGELYVSRQPHWHHQLACLNLLTALHGWNAQTRAGVVNDVPDSAREGLHAMAADANGNLFAAWLDLRSKGTATQ